MFALCVYVCVNPYTYGIGRIDSRKNKFTMWHMAETAAIVVGRFGHLGGSRDYSDDSPYHL